ncbi:MAG: NADPH:quinone oxidoreductase family protein [Chloroflexi bacterium]|nr:NADPH:quinone oxidoreductase family protein [Chloroflexota bacterium]
MTAASMPTATMRALLCREFGLPAQLSVTSRPLPEPAAGEVLIQVRACGVNFPDVLMVAGQYQVRPALPFIPGLELAGEIAAVGKGVSSERIGERVCAVVECGAMAEWATAPAERCFAIPAALAFETAAGFALVYGTSHMALVHRARLQAGESLLVLGAAGGVGLAAVELGVWLGARVIAAASSAEKLALARAYGAEAGIQYSEEDLRERVFQLTEGRGADVIFDPVGGDLFDQAVRCLAWEGRHLVVGFASGRIPSLPANRALLKNMALVGVYWGAYLEREPTFIQGSLSTLFQLAATGQLRPHISRAYPLAEAGAALTELAERRALGKLILTTA